MAVKPGKDMSKIENVHIVDTPDVHRWKRPACKVYRADYDTIHSSLDLFFAVPEKYRCKTCEKIANLRLLAQVKL